MRVVEPAAAAASPVTRKNSRSKFSSSGLTSLSTVPADRATSNSCVVVNPSGIVTMTFVWPSTEVSVSATSAAASAWRNGSAGPVQVSS